MFNNQDSKKIDLKKMQEIVKNFFDRMGEKIEIEEIYFKEGVVFLNLKSKDNQILIGEKGRTLFCLQHLLKKLLVKKIKEIFFLDLDINSYKKRKADYLRNLAKDLADEVALTKKEREFLPMLPYERRIIHLEIAKRKDVDSYSVGEGTERRVVIKPH